MNRNPILQSIEVRFYQVGSHRVEVAILDAFFFKTVFLIANKSTAGMQHTPPQDIFNAKKIILKLDLFMQSLKKIGKEMPKIESEKPIYNVNQGP